MANIILFGGHGKIALLTEPLLVKRGDTVTAVIRNPAQSDAVAATGATPLVADVEQLSVADLAQIIAGHDAVVWSAGAGGGNPARTYAVDQDAAIRTMEAAQLAGVPRYVMVSYFDAAIDHNVPAENSFFAYAQAKAAADQHLRATELDWTVLGPSALTLEEPTGAIETKAEKSTRVSRANVAAVIARVLESPSTVRQTINFNDGDTPIEQVI